MHFTPWCKNGARRLSRPVHEYMRQRFNLLPDYLNMLRCFEYDGLFKGKQVRCIRIFSPDKAREYHFLIKTSLDLEQHPEVLFFQGYIDISGNVYVADRRIMSYQEKVASQRS